MILLDTSVLSAALLRRGTGPAETPLDQPLAADVTNRCRIAVATTLKLLEP